MINNPQSCFREQLKSILTEILTEIMPSFNKTTECKALKANTAKYSVDAVNEVKIAELNGNRHGLTIFNESNYDLIIGTGDDADGTEGAMDAILEIVKPNSMYELPVGINNSIYCGRIYALSYDTSNVNVTEFVSQ